jgi:hypothetical protein
MATHRLYLTQKGRTNMKTKAKAWIVTLVVLALPIVIALASGAPGGRCPSCFG